MPTIIEGDRHGSTYEPARDRRRLNGQSLRVFNFMLDGKWHTLRKIADAAAPATESSVSARLRDLRKPEFGGFTVERESLGAGLFQYRLIVPTEYRQMSLFDD